MKRQMLRLGAVDLLSKVGIFVGISRTAAAVGRGEARGKRLGLVSPLSHGSRPSMQVFRDLGPMSRMPLATDRSGGGNVSPRVNTGLRQSSRRKPHVSFLAFSVGLRPRFPQFCGECRLGSAFEVSLAFLWLLGGAQPNHLLSGPANAEARPRIGVAAWGGMSIPFFALGNVDRQPEAVRLQDASTPLQEVSCDGYTATILTP